MTLILIVVVNGNIFFLRYGMYGIVVLNGNGVLLLDGTKYLNGKSFHGEMEI